MFLFKNNPAPALVMGRWINVRFRNGAVFSLWSPGGLKGNQGEARSALLNLANGQYEGIYTAADIERLWESKTKPSEAQ